MRKLEKCVVGQLNVGNKRKDNTDKEERKQKTDEDGRKKNKMLKGREDRRGEKRGRKRGSQYIDRSDLSAARQPGRRLSLCCHSLACRHLTPLLQWGGGVRPGDHAFKCVCCVVHPYISIWYLECVHGVCIVCPVLQSACRCPTSSWASGVE